jgi:integrase
VVTDRKRREARRTIFTEEKCRKFPLRKSQYQVWDGGAGRGSDERVRGLSELISPAGARSYRSTYYFPNSAKPHSRYLGTVGQMSLAEARVLCRQDRKNAKEGIDPKGGPSGSDTYADVVRDYVKRVQIGQKKNISHAETQRVLLTDCEPWLRRSVATIKPTEIERLLELVRDGDPEQGLKPRPYLANSLYGRLSTFFAWCAKPTIGKLKTSPMVGVDKPWDGAQPRHRDWFKGAAADQTIKSLWKAADQIGQDASYHHGRKSAGCEGAYLKLLLLTGKRKSAIANMRWEEIDDDWFWNAPQSDRKNKRLHGVPLSSLAQRILHPRKERGFVFAGDDNGRIYVDGLWLQTKIIRASGMKDFFFHGTRHIAETKAAELKIPPHIRDLMFDHVPNRGSGRGYDHHEYKDELREAFELWASHIEHLVTGAQGVKRLR